MNDAVFKASLEDAPIPSSTLLSEFVKGPDTDLYVFYGKSLSIQRESNQLLNKYKKK
jgi:hypothetical protein